MSQMEYKTVLRGKISCLDGLNKTEVLAYFNKILGEANYIDEDEDTKEVYYFEYEGEFKPVHDFRQNKWGLDLILFHSVNDDVKINSEYCEGVTLSDFNILIDKLMEKCVDIKKDTIKLISYDWYNGGDEPINL